MTDRKMELVREEDRGWMELHELLANLAREDMLRPGYTEDWSVKDLLGHLGSWWAETAHALERIRMGTYQPEKLDIDAMNRRFYELCKDLDLDTINAELHAARNRALEELWRLPEVTPPTEEWFRESGRLHYDEHLPGLERFVEALSGS